VISIIYTVENLCCLCDTTESSLANVQEKLFELDQDRYWSISYDAMDQLQ